MKSYSSITRRFEIAESSGLCFIPTVGTELRPLYARVHSRELFEPAPGLFVRTEFWNSLPYEKRGICLLQSLAQKHPNWVFASTSAAWIHGFTQTYLLLKQIHLLAKNGTHPRPSPLIQRIYVNSAEYSQICQHNGILATPEVRTVFDCARLLPFRMALPICDAALRSGSVSKSALLEFANKHKRCKGWKSALFTLTESSPLPESGGESLACALMKELGFQKPQLQVTIPDPLTGKPYRADFLWNLPDGHRVIGELDGKQKYIDPLMTHGKSTEEIVGDEMMRESRISIYDVRIMRFTYEDLLNPPAFAALLDSYGIPRVST